MPKYNIEYFRKHIKFYIFGTIRNRSTVVSKGSKGSTVHVFKLSSYKVRYKCRTSKSYSLERVSKFENDTAYCIFHSCDTIYKDSISCLCKSIAIPFGIIAKERL